MQGLCLKDILYLCVGAEQQIVSDFKARHPGRHTAGALIQASGKLVLIDKLLPKLKEKGHKVEQTFNKVIKKASPYNRMLNILCDAYLPMIYPLVLFRC